VKIVKKQTKKTAGKKNAAEKKVFRGGEEFHLTGCQGGNCHTNDNSPSVQEHVD
jgi:hypothetical protein